MVCYLFSCEQLLQAYSEGHRDGQARTKVSGLSVPGGLHEGSLEEAHLNGVESRELRDSFSWVLMELGKALQESGLELGPPFHTPKQCLDLDALLVGLLLLGGGVGCPLFSTTLQAMGP